MKKILLSAFFTLLAITLVFANEGTSIIKGKITTADDKPAADVTVVVKGTSKGALTNAEGFFIIKNLPAGSFELEISLIGYQTVTEKVDLGDNETNIINIKLQLSQKELEDVIVSSRKSFTRAYSDYVAK